MTIYLVYLRIIKRADPTLLMPFDYGVAEKRWLETYKKFRPAIPHRVTIVNCGSHTDFDDAFDQIAYNYAYYDGLGSDCGTYQSVAKRMEADLVICFNTVSYFWRPAWLEPFVAAYQKYGKGVYGPTSSYQFWPHLRTPCIGFSPEIMRRYPHLCDTRAKAIDFESGRNNFSLWASDNGYPSMLVTENGCYPRKEWRTPPNIFRRGDQSNCLVWDRHTLLYAEATEEGKANFAKDADTLNETL